MLLPSLPLILNSGELVELSTPTTTLLRHIDLLATMDDARREIVDGAVLIEGHRITQVGPTPELPHSADTIIDLAGHVVIPGMINTHHHMFQSLTRAEPGVQDVTLFDWLRRLYPIWAGLTPEMTRVSTKLAMAELLLSGCTTSSDHMYLFPNGCRLEDSLEAAEEIGMRFHACRGSMSVGQSKGGLPPDALVEDEAAILGDSRRVIEQFHNPADFAMTRIALAPCSPFSVSRDLMRETAVLARAYGVSPHTHLAENDADVAYSREKFGATPAEYAEELGWVGPDVWHAHCVKIGGAGIDLFARTETGVAHCPCSNMRLGSGIAPIRAMRDRGVRVALGVDGSASNDAGHMLAEARQAMLLQRVALGADAMPARELLEIATLGGAAVLGRRDIGALAVGMAADLAAFDVRGVGFAGAQRDKLAALLFCGPVGASLTMVHGRVLVRNGRLCGVDQDELVGEHNRQAGLLFA